MTIDSTPTVLCFGEILWDSLPQGLFPGGAPINVAYHLRQLGNRAIPVTAVGNDFLGQELVARLQRWELDTEFVGRVVGKQTGIVQARLDAKGSATYTIIEDVAWDWIEFPSTLKTIASGSEALVYGTLAQRSENNRQQLAKLIEWAPKALKVFDVNLRAPFDSPELVWRLAAESDLIKLNDEELRKLLGRSIAAGELEAAVRLFVEKCGVTRVCVTAGARGAGLLFEGQWFWCASEPIVVADTIGAGDAFLAALVHGLLGVKPDPAEVMRRASRLAEFVASQRGATPAYSVSFDGRIQAS